MKIHLIFFLYIIVHICVACAPDMVVSSPDEQNSISLSLDSQGVLNYQIKSGDDILVSQSVIGLLAKDESLSFNNGLELVEACSRVIDEKYNLPTGKCSSYTNYANEKTFLFRNSSGKELELTCRAYNDGVAFRYKVIADSIAILNETTDINLQPGVKTWMMDWIRHYENYYPERMIDTICYSTEFLYPVLV